jgi:hypothetical protein
MSALPMMTQMRQNILTWITMRVGQKTSQASIEEWAKELEPQISNILLPQIRLADQIRHRFVAGRVWMDVIAEIEATRNM